MAIHICPKCKQQGFFWSIDREVSEKTLWWCNQCNYEAQEDETKEIDCPICLKKSYMLLEDDKHYYRYCVHYQRIENATGRPPNQAL